MPRSGNIRNGKESAGMSGNSPKPPLLPSQSLAPNVAQEEQECEVTKITGKRRAGGAMNMYKVR